MGKQELAKINTSDYLSKISEPLKSYAMRSYDHGYFMRSVMIALSEIKGLSEMLKTEAGQNALYHSLKKAASTGLSLSPTEGQAALISYGNTVNYQIMKNGLVKLALESGLIDTISCDIVRENDIFDIFKSSDGDEYKHSPARKNRGEVDGYYAAIKRRNGERIAVYMSRDEVVEHMQSYATSRGDGSPWKKSFDGMALKTVIKKLLRNTHITDSLQAAVSIDDNEEATSSLIEPENVKVLTAETLTAQDDDSEETQEHNSPI